MRSTECPSSWKFDGHAAAKVLPVVHTTTADYRFDRKHVGLICNLLRSQFRRDSAYAPSLSGGT